MNLKKIHIYPFLAMIFLIISIPGISQNPFDIRSRRSPDTLKLVQSRNPEKSSDSAVGKMTEPHTRPGRTPDEEERSEKEIEEEVESEIVIPAPEPQPQDLGTPLSDSEDKYSTDQKKSDLFSNAPSFSSTKLWFYLFDLVILLILASIFIYDKKIFSLVRKAFTHENFLRFLYRDTFLKKPGVFYYLNILFILGMGFMAFRTANYFGFEQTFLNYLLIQGVVLLLFAIKHIALSLLKGLVDNSFEVSFYQYWMILSAGFIGIWIIPLVLMVSVLPSNYLKYALIISGIIIGLATIFRIVKALLQGRFYLSKHTFHFFLYFCAVEIIPLIVFTDILTHY